uniref:Uncharacterized protein n=1 Tax=Oryza punctata TaxID=4537 RepID=A0A0E0JZZ9_ORYPU
MAGAPSPGGSGRGRGGTGMRWATAPAQELASARTCAAVEQVEPLRVVEANARDGMGGSRGESSSAPPLPRSRVLRQGELEEDKKVLAIAKNSPSPLGFAPRITRHDRQRSYDVASTSRPAPEMGEPLHIITKKAMSNKNRAYTGGNQGRSSSDLLPQSRFWQGMREEAKKVLGIAKNSSSRLAARILCDKQALPESAGTSRPAPEQWLCSQKSTSLVADVMAAVCLDQSVLSPCASTGTLSFLLVTSEGHVQDILGNLSGKAVFQTEDLHHIRILSDSTKGARSFLNKCPDMISDEERLSIILSLSIHRPNREKIAVQNNLPGFLKQIVEEAIKIGNASAAASLVKVASIVAILSAFDMFRKSVLIIGVVTLLCNLLNFENAAVRKEAAIAVLALCAYIGNIMVNDDVLLLLDYLPKGPCVLEVICNQAVVEQLVNIVMAEHESGLVTSQGIYSALPLILIITQNDVEHMENFMKRLRELSSNELPMQTMFQLNEIISLLSQRLYSHKPKEFVVKWRDDDRREWNDMRIVRRLRPLRAQERMLTKLEFRDRYKNYIQGKNTYNQPYKDPVTIATGQMGWEVGVAAKPLEILM